MPDAMTGSPDFTDEIILILGGIYIAFISPTLRARAAQRMIPAAGRISVRAWQKPLGYILIAVGIGLAVWEYLRLS